MPTTKRNRAKRRLVLVTDGDKHVFYLVDRNGNQRFLAKLDWPKDDFLLPNFLAGTFERLGFKVETFNLAASPAQTQTAENKADISVDS
jgi:hypothetical protein